MKSLFLLIAASLLIFTSYSQVGVGTINPAVKLHVKSNGSMLRLEGSDHALMEFYPKGSSTRYGYLGIPNASSNDIFLYNQHASGAIEFGTNNIKRMQLASNGKVSIGSATPTTMLHIENGNVMGTDEPSSNSVPSIYVYNNNSNATNAHALVAIRTNGNNSGNPYMSFDINGIRGYSIGMDNSDNEKLKFYSNWSFNSSMEPVMTMTTDNNIGIGTTSPGSKLEINSADATSFKITSSSSDNNGMVILNANTGSNWGSNWHEFIYFQKQGTNIGSIRADNNGAGVAYLTTSDYRLKTDYKDFNGIEILQKLKVYDYAWKENNSRMYGFKAHEIQEVIPYMATGTKDSIDTKGSPVYQMVDYGKLTPVLAKAIQEQQEMIVAQEKRIEKLEKMIQELLNSKK